ncbi:MAG: sigma-70 family RNA polymerase sigma factor [Bacteroidetes bacterium]|jgi:RNA polymerase sigma factor (sigma-70 family)|nr:sigma-70 family RNA polymerase sigma factor [Bacteroidota bacterium]MBT6687621.1 sigma-70 family RNA polymerase sigma factor [Bacteroidota bacterium]MBT7144746.1 sigma-70 family RNA polymerase sigma factor [Bacteroidota bacterium]MBT7491766.1 sigma-70 family RNA polymerase sigma factor [Bacteroidota bacterium]
MDLANKAVVERLVEACIRGDRKSQQYLYQTFYGKMLVVCRRYADNNEDAKDILHDGFIKVFQKISGFKNLGSLEGWIRRIIVNNAIDNVRKKKEFLLSSEDDTTLENIAYEANDETEAEMLTKMKAKLIVKLMQKLTPKYRAVFNLYAIENYQHKEIAEILNISIGTSKSNYSKAKAKIKDFYQDYVNKNEIYKENEF